MLKKNSGFSFFQLLPIVITMYTFTGFCLTNYYKGYPSLLTFFTLAIGVTVGFALATIKTGSKKLVKQ